MNMQKRNSVLVKYKTFLRTIRKKKELNLSDLALSLCCLGRIRTLTGGTRIRRATITPQGNVSVSFRFDDCKVKDFS